MFDSYFRLFTSSILVFVFMTSNAWADANWKRGRIYYRMVCTACHVNDAGGSISPSTLTMAGWKQYIEMDEHAKNGKANKKLSYYVGHQYRDSIKHENKAAAKLIKLSDEELLNDVRAFVIHGAKDSDTPATCQ